MTEWREKQEKGDSQTDRKNKWKERHHCRRQTHYVETGKEIMGLRQKTRNFSELELAGDEKGRDREFGCNEL